MEVYFFFICFILVTVGLNILAKKFLKQRWNLWLGYGLPALLFILFMWNVSAPHNLFSDFNKAYYPAGRQVIENPSSLYDKNCADNTICFVNIPIIAYLFTPFSPFPLHRAQYLLAVLSVLAVVASCYFTVKLTKVSGDKRIAIIGLFAINGPLYYSFRYGNATHFVFLLLIGAFFCIQNKREVFLGILVAIAALMKIPLVLFGVYFVLRRRWQVVAGFSAALLVIGGASLLLFGVDLHLTWFRECIQSFAGKPLAAYNVQSVDGFLARLLTDGNLKNWLPLEVGWDFKVMRYALLSLLFGTTFWVFWRSKSPTTLEEENLEFSIVLCLALVTSPISWTHYYLFLLLPLSLYVGNKLVVPNQRLWFSLMIPSILLISFPVTSILVDFKPLTFFTSKLLISHYFFGGVLLLGVLLAAQWHNSKRFQQSQSGVGSL
ncbi:glycosyltransferase family 87 protein [Coleofasciculus sp. H7-2]|uniref:glycosyltransferase family 87 protein n=1 Tax=Coleofasciculus sp. H7-2 TaxID=3351545 RepID=UPI00366E3D46